MPHECDACGETFRALSRLRLHDCQQEESQSQNPLSSFDGFLDSISESIETNMQQNEDDRRERGLDTASDSLQSTLKTAAQGDVDAAFRFIAQYERELQDYHDAEEYDTYRDIFWAFYEPATAAIDEIVTQDGWSVLGELIDAYPRESTADEPLVSPILVNVVGRHVIRTRLHDGVDAIAVGGLEYLGSFWESMGDTSGEEAFAYGWGIGHPDHDVADHLNDVVTAELFWVRGVLPHAFYADQHAAADLLGSLLTADRIDNEDRYLLASALAAVDRDSALQTPRYWDVREELDYQFEWDESVRAGVRETIEAAGFHERLPKNWTFSDMEI